MFNVSLRKPVYDLLNEWVGNQNQSKNVINCLVEFLTEDLFWLNANISAVDRDTFIRTAKKLENEK